MRRGLKRIPKLFRLKPKRLGKDNPAKAILGFSEVDISRNVMPQPTVSTQYGLRPPDLARALGSSELARRAVFHDWIKPIIRQKKLTLYDSGDAALVWQRIRNGEIPPPIPRPAKIGGVT